MPLIPWATLADLPEDRPTLPGGDEEWSGLLAASSEVLYALTGRRFGGIRERAIELYAPHGPGDARCYGCRAARVRLPNRDVRELVAVERPDGTVLPVASYRIDRGGYLTRAPDPEPFAILPTCRAPLVVRYRFGRNPSPAGITHAVTLTTALAQARLDPDSSPLPAGVTQIARQGITFTMRAASELIAAGQTGLPSVDVWLGSVNPNRLRRPPRSWSPDTDAPYRALDEPQEVSP